MLNRPQFVNRLGPGSWVPLAAHQVQAYLFALQGDVGNLRSLCDRYLNVVLDRQFTYAPLGRLVLLTLDHTGALGAQSGPLSQIGTAVQNEVSLWVPLVAYRDAGDHDVLDHVALYVPYIFVDNTMSMSGAREIMGWPKEFGAVNLPDPAAADHFGLDVLGIQTFGPTAQFAVQPLLRIDRQPGAAEAQDLGEWVQVIPRVVDALLSAAEILDDLELIRALLQDAFQQSIPMVFLKQFYDAADSSYACYQVLIEAPVHIVSATGLRLLPGPYQVNWCQLDSQPVVPDLGIAAQEVVASGFGMDLDFVLDPGEIVGRSTP